MQNTALRHGAFIAATLLVCHAHADDNETIRTRMIDDVTAASTPPGDPDADALHASLSSTAQLLMSRQNADGSFNVINADGVLERLRYLNGDDTTTGLPPDSSATAGVRLHYQFLMKMSYAYVIPGGPLYHSAGLVDAIERGLSFGSSYFCEDDSCRTEGDGPSWFHWEINVPLYLGPTLVFMDGALDPALKKKVMNALHFHVGTIAQLDKGEGFAPFITLSGDNLTFVAMSHLRFGLLGDGEPEFQAARRAFEKGLVIDAHVAAHSPAPPGDGVKPDYSFQQHRGVLYTGGYGSGFVGDATHYQSLTLGTAYALSSSATQLVSDYIADGVVWQVSPAGFFDPLTAGRYVTRPGWSNGGNPNGGAALSAVRACFYDSTRRAELLSDAKALISLLGKGGADSWRDSAAVEAAPGAGSLPSGHRHFFSSDHTVHRRSSYYASVKMFSTRVQSGELIGSPSEGRRGSRQSDGQLYLVHSGREYIGQRLFPALDWARLPGITVEQSPTAADEQYGFGTQAFVGGTGDGQNGVSAMAIAPLGSQLTGQKSWFFFDDFIVFMGSRITSTSRYPVETIIEQWPLSTPTQPLIADGVNVASGPYDNTLHVARWLEADGLGYYVPNASDVKTEIKDQTGAWSSIGSDSTTAPVSGRFLTLALEHGVAPKNASYAYAITLAHQDMAAWSDSQAFEILQNDERIAAVRSGTGVGIVFWQPGSIEVAPDITVTTDTALTVWLTDDGNALQFRAADPAAQAGNAKLSVTGTFIEAKPTSGNIRVALSATGADIIIARALGQTRSARMLRHR